MNPALLCPIAIVTTTVASAADAEQLAQGAITQQLAACAQVEPITSHYRWQEQLHASAEWRVLFKTVPAGVQALWQWLLQHHPYSVPQLLLRMEDSHADYTAWVTQQVRQAPDGPQAV